MCSGNTNQTCEGRLIVDLARAGPRIFWPPCATRKFYQHLARHEVGPKDVSFLFIHELRRDLNCVHGADFNNIIWPKITNALRYRLRELERAGTVRHTERGALYAPWTARWLDPAWDGDVREPPPGWENQHGQAHNQQHHHDGGYGQPQPQVEVADEQDLERQPQAQAQAQVLARARNNAAMGPARPPTPPAAARDVAAYHVRIPTNPPIIETSLLSSNNNTNNNKKPTRMLRRSPPRHQGAELEYTAVEWQELKNDGTTLLGEEGEDTLQEQETQLELGPGHNSGWESKWDSEWDSEDGGGGGGGGGLLLDRGIVFRSRRSSASASASSSSSYIAIAPLDLAERFSLLTPPPGHMDQVDHVALAELANDLEVLKMGEPTTAHQNTQDMHAAPSSSVPLPVPVSAPVPTPKAVPDTHKTTTSLDVTRQCQQQVVRRDEHPAEHGQTKNKEDPAKRDSLCTAQQPHQVQRQRLVNAVHHLLDECLELGIQLRQLHAQMRRHQQQQQAKWLVLLDKARCLQRRAASKEFTHSSETRDLATLAVALLGLHTLL